MGLATPAFAWPDKSVNVIVPFPAGGATDTIARAVSNHLGTQFKQTFVVENKAGATGSIGAAQVARAPADGYTLLVSSLAPFVVAPHLMKGLPYDPLKDFSYLTIAVQTPNVLVVNPHLAPKVNNLQDVVAMLKARPGQVSFATSGAGSSDHLTAELFWQKSGTKGLHVPYKGGAPAITDLLGGQVDMSFQNVNSVFQHIKAGKLKAIAVTGTRRSPVLPDVPTTAEAGIQGVEVYSWQGIAAPKNLPADVKAQLHGGLMKALRDPALTKQFTDVGLEVVANSPEEFTQFQAKEYARWKQVIETGGITAN
ncbi:tripartite tricarboxylate transporter substrate binding protein [Acidovorax sp. D4N7]|uniref:Tripartite tricarboxylate transporter substrate binding protein n=2 Tax=Comamonas endophytica TaxID=2949090 RepID=A0ABY6GEA6_9BURK|nr:MULTISPECIES: tripartite tricarboxylate transporter substrate binding protein [unclassified Acidovorax]MCD2512208.1 tripartite tricarboxylate transporter substrate binding protein [Acidovorax sp. D4N7]UYG53226.1 tripartite tricarboxylate transporter substrate binding protein [Acidovorax sp. 5MLIR]